METLESFIGEPKVIRPPLVIASPEPDPEKEPEVRVSYPASWVKRDISTTQEIGEFIIDHLNRNTESFQGRWLVWSGTDRDLERGKLVFEVQSCSADAYRARRRQAVITIKLPREPWWVRFFRSAGSFLLRVSRREEKQCCA